MKSPAILEDTAEVLETTIPRVQRLKSLSDKEKEWVIRRIKEAAENFKELARDVKNDNEELAEFFFKKAKELKNMSVDKEIEREGKKKYLKLVDKMLLYSRSAKYDFQPDNMKELKKVYRKYLFGMTLFFVLTGMYLNQFLAMTALILAIPIILSMLSLQKRGHLGLLLAYSAIPIPFVTGIMVMEYSIRALNDPSILEQIAQALHKSVSFAQGYLAVLMVLAAVELYLLTVASVGLYKHRHAFL